MTEVMEKSNLVPTGGGIIRTENLEVFYGKSQALRAVNLSFLPNTVTALIGPSGCGKSSFLRCLNRMNDSDLIPGARVKGRVIFKGADIYSRQIRRETLRSQIGMVFQKPNPFPLTIAENLCFGPDVNGMAYNKAELIETVLRKANLWDEVKDKLSSQAQRLSGGQQQRLCIARALAVNPEVLLMDEPCSALDPISTRVIEELILELKQSYTIIMVTHHLGQAKRVASMTAFFNTADIDGAKQGYLAEFGTTEQIFGNPINEDTRNYINGGVARGEAVHSIDH
jgi:phosphate transport system ATP-binding protein